MQGVRGPALIVGCIKIVGSEFTFQDTMYHAMDYARDLIPMVSLAVLCLEAFFSISGFLPAGRLGDS